MSGQNVFLRDFLKRTIGMEMGPEKDYLIEGRLGPIALTEGIASVGELIEKLKREQDGELAKMVIDAMTTHETLFFRDTEPFSFLRDVILPDLEKRRASERRIRIWSAACSTGQEAYSVLMTLGESPLRFFEKGWQVDLLATDISDSAMEKAKRGLYSAFETQRGLPVEMRTKYFEERNGNWKIKDELRNRVRFQVVNLIHPFTGVGPFDIVFCRNVLIYFSVETRKQILAQIAKVLAPDGYLYLGGAETVMGLSDQFSRFENSKTSVYKRSKT